LVGYRVRFDIEVEAPIVQTTTSRSGPRRRRAGEHYVLRDTDGRTITPEQGRQIVRAHHAVDKQTRIKAANTRQSQRRKGRTGREQKESPSAPVLRPDNTSINTVEVA
jgi:hypothetical protein